MSSNWHSVMSEYLTEFEINTTAALERINTELVKSGMQFDRIKKIFKDGIKNRLDQAVNVFEILHATPPNQTPYRNPSVENDFIQKDIKVEVSSDEESNATPNVTTLDSGLTSPLQNILYSRLNSTDSFTDRRSVCSPSTSNQPVNTPLMSPEHQMWTFPIKIEPNDLESDGISSSQTDNEPVVKMEDVPTLNSGEVLADSSQGVSNIIFSTSTSSYANFTTTSGQGKQNDSSHAANPVCRESLKRMTSVTQNDEHKRQKLDQETKNSTEVSNDDPKTKIGDRKILFGCFHCQHKEQMPPQLWETFEEVQNHWEVTHPTLPFRFYAIAVGACYYCKGKEIGTFAQLQKHSNLHHSSYLMIVVDQQNNSKCGLCHKMLPASDMVGHFKQEHYPRTLVNICSPICFTQDEIHYLTTLNSSRSEIKSFKCGNCHDTKSISEESYFEHIQRDLYHFMCSKCEFCHTTIAKLVEHEEMAHNLFDTWSKGRLQYLIDGFESRLQRQYLRTRIIFSNGLILFKHNMLKTSFDDREAFWRLKAKFSERKIRQKIEELDAMNRNTTTSITLKTSTTIDKDKILSEQRAFSHNLCISGYPRLDKGMLINVFLSICSLLELAVSKKDVEDAFQRKGNDIIVRMADRGLKGEVQKKWKMANMKIFAPKFKRSLRNLEINDGIKIDINIDLIDFFKPLWAYAEQAWKNGQISRKFMTDEGLMVAKSPKSKKHVIWSKRDLDLYINSNQV